VGIVLINQFLIYALTDPRSGLVRYVGQSSIGMKRPGRHRQPGYLRHDRGHKGNWIRKLNRLGLAYGVQVLELLPNAEELDAAEKHWISAFRLCGSPLVNLTDGGDGRRGYVMSQETKDKISRSNSAARLGGRFAGMFHGRYGKHLSQQSREKISRGNGGRPVMDESGQVFQTISDAARAHNLDISSLSKVVRGKAKRIGGQKFSYAPEATP
jgi:hypothetical protein